MQTNRRQRPQQKTTHLEAAKAKRLATSQECLNSNDPEYVTQDCIWLRKARWSFPPGKGLKPPWMKNEVSPYRESYGYLFGLVVGFFYRVYQKNTQTVISPWVYFHVFMFVHSQYESHDRSNQYRMSLWSELIPIPGWWLVLWGRTG